MSVLTKVFVVLVTLLSVALVAAMVPFVANTEHYRLKWEDETSARQIAQATAQQRQTQLNEERSERQQEVHTLQEKIKDLERQATDMMSSQNQLRAQITEKDFEIEKLRAQQSQLASANANLTATALAQATELSEHRRQMREHAELVVGLEQRVTELDNDNLFLRQRLNYYKEEVASLQQGKQEAQGQLRKIPPNVRRDYTNEDPEKRQIDPPHDINGQVTEVQASGGETWVMVNVGRNDGVMPQMRFYVQRGEQYVGTLIIKSVDDRNAAGMMSLLQPDQEVITGDAVKAHREM